MSTLETVRDKANTDLAFAQSLIFAPEDTCKKAGVVLNTSEAGILVNAMKEVKKYYGEQLQLATIPPIVLDARNCFIFC